MKWTRLRPFVGRRRHCRSPFRLVTLAATSVLALSALPGPAASGAPAARTPSAGFSLRQQEGTWRLVTPDGLPFFSLGVCCVQPGVARKHFDPENPGYA